MKTNDLVQLVKADASLVTPNERAVFGNEAVAALQNKDLVELMEDAVINIRVSYLMMYALTKRGIDADVIMNAAIDMDPEIKD